MAAIDMASTISSSLSKWLASPSRNVTLALIPVLFALYRISKKPARPAKVAKRGERVLILGASSGVGRTMAKQYAARGARVCVVGRREALLLEVQSECRTAQDASGAGGDDVISVPADFTSVDDVVNIRGILQAKWGGLDTLVVAAGVSALQPLMAVAGVEAERGTPLKDATKDGIQHTVNVAAAATRGNFVGPLIAAITFIPLLSSTSKAPAIVLVNSVASIIPAPTRTLYASTKASSLVLYQALSIEHPNIAFTFFMPATIEGDFRASAVDSGPVRELDPNKHGLKREDVARRGIQAADNSEGAVFMPVSMRYAHILYWIWPALIERMAKRKYNFEV